MEIGSSFTTVTTQQAYSQKFGDWGGFYWGCFCQEHPEERLHSDSLLNYTDFDYKCAAERSRHQTRVTGMNNEALMPTASIRQAENK